MTPAPGISFYPGRTDHERLTPFRHAFSYRIFPFLLDMDRLDETASALRFFSHNGLNLFSLHDTDHGACDGSDPRIWARKTFADAGVNLNGGALSLLCFPRVLNYAFNPLSVWFGRGPSGEQWDLTQGLAPLLGSVGALLAEQAAVCLSTYAVGLSPLSLVGALGVLGEGELEGLNRVVLVRGR